MAYFPNSSAGEVLDQQCCECIIGMENPCPVAFVQMEYNYKQFDKNGKRNELSGLLDRLIAPCGTCLMKRELDKTGKYKDIMELVGKLKSFK